MMSERAVAVAESRRERNGFLHESARAFYGIE
jgi:hypothetical protein